MTASAVSLGCMRMPELNEKGIDAIMDTALECGINYFDHADIYESEECFGAYLKRHKGVRENIYIQTKCSIHDGQYDFSKGHIIKSVENSLSLLGVDYVDALLLHRPDLLMEPEEVAEAFTKLEKEGKVGHFGVSNHSPMQIELLKKYVEQPLKINQMRLSIANATMISSGANVNLCNNDGINYDGYLRDYCRLNEITIQPWSPLQQGFIKSCFLNEEKFSDINKTLAELGEKYGLTPAGMAIAWLLRLPEKTQPIVGTTKPERVKAVAQAADITMSREDWYRIYREAGYPLP